MPYNFKGWEILILIGIIVLLFGAKRLPDAARGIGRSLRIFKAETKGLHDDAKGEDTPAVKASGSSPAVEATAAPAAEPIAATETTPAAQPERTES